MGPPPNRPPAAQPAPAAPCSSASWQCMQRHGGRTGIGHALAEHEPSSNGSAEIDAAAAAQSEHYCGDSGGLLRLLMRARDCAAAGFKNTARHHAVEALEFHHTARRDAATSSASGELTLPEAASHACSKQRRRLCVVLLQHRVDHHRPANSYAPAVSEGVSSSSDDKNNTVTDGAEPGSDGVPSPDGSPRCLKRKRSDGAQHEPADAGNLAPSTRSAAGDEGAAIEQGPRSLVRRCASWHLQVAGRSEQLCQVAMTVPKALAARLPNVLGTARVRPRRGLVTRGQLACPTTVVQASERQWEELRTMARLQLVAIAALDECSVVLVPFLNHRQELRTVTFAAALCS